MGAPPWSKVQLPGAQARCGVDQETTSCSDLDSTLKWRPPRTPPPCPGFLLLPPATRKRVFKKLLEIEGWERRNQNREESLSGQLPCCGCPLPALVPAWTVEPVGRGTDLPRRGAGPRPQSLESRGARQEVDLSKAGGCKMTLGPERKTSGCSGDCGELNGGQGRGYPHTAPSCKLDRA